MGQIVLTVGMAMLAAGLILPFIVGSAIPPTGYNILQIGGIVLAIIGSIMRRSGRPKA